MYDHQAIGKIAKNKNEELRISLSEHNGHKLISMRVWEYSATHSDWFPSKKGLAMRVSQLSEMIEILQAAESEAKKQGLQTARSLSVVASK